MLPNTEGRFCNSCQKSVVDFSVMADEDIQLYITKNHNQQLCGRFKSTQIQRIVIDLPKNIFSIKMPVWMRFLVACLIIFGISIFPFETSIAGKPTTEFSFYQGEQIAVKAEKKPRILKKKKRRSKNRSRLITEGMIWGNIWGQPDRPLKSIFDLPAKDLEGCSIKMVTKEANLENKSQPQEEDRVPTPYMPTEFILPSILAFRRKNNNNTMD